MLNRNKIGLGLIAWLILCLAISAAAQGGSLGQSSTLLPNRDTLLLGGFNTLKAPVSDAFIISSTDNSVRKLNRGMRTPRAGQTATVLPDGTVLIFGGVGPNGKLVTDAELFDPQTSQFSLLPEVQAVPRAFHTATLLTDGTVLFAGGTTAGGQLPDDVQLWDYRSRNALSFHALLMTPRQGHTEVVGGWRSAYFSRRRPLRPAGISRRSLRSDFKTIQVCRHAGNGWEP